METRRPVCALVGAAGLLVLAQGCSISFAVHASGQAMVQASPLGSELPLSSLGPLSEFSAFDISQTQDFKNQGISKSQIQSVKLTSLSLTITQPSGETFDFLNSISFLAGADGQQTVEVAQTNPIPMSVTTFDVGVDTVELADYVTAPTMSITANAGGQPPPQDTTITIDAVFEVTAKP